MKICNKKASCFTLTVTFNAGTDEFAAKAPKMLQKLTVLSEEDILEVAGDD